MSHILHFYHLVALDYVKPVVFVGGNFIPLTRPYLAPRYHDNYYINTQRVLAVVGLGIIPQTVYKGDGTGVLETLPGWNVNPGDAINNYLTGQYLQALNIRRICHELQAIFSGRAPQCSGWTPGGATATFTAADIANANAKLAQIAAFVGDVTDFATGTAGTYMFDAVAAAHLFPEYFWIGNSYSRFMAFGWGEEAGQIPLTGALGGVFGSINNTDKRASRRGWALSAVPPVAVNNVDIMKIGESIAGSRYKKLVGGQYLDGAGWKHPWSGKTQPDANGQYSWLKSPGYDTGGGIYQRFEVGPLSRMVVQGTYFAGVISFLYPLLAPVLNPGLPGPDCSTGGAGWGQALQPVYASLAPPCNGGPNLSGVGYTGDSVLDRIAARAVETRLMVDMAQHFLNQLSGSVGVDGWSTSGCTDPSDSILPVGVVKKGYGMTEASRGALSHWIKAKHTATGVKTTLYQAVVPTTWNASPRDVNGTPGPAEESLQSGGGLWIADANQPIEIPRVTHSYDFCIACAVHLVTPKGDIVTVDVPALPG